MASGRPDYTSQALIRGTDSGTHRTVAVDSGGNMLSLIKGQFGGAPVTIAVDASGNILGVLQGDYAGSLKTLAVDDKGRMLAVLSDPEDVFGNPHYMGAGELAARTGSPAVFDRRGQVIFMDPGGFNVNQYILVTSGADSNAVESAASGLIGPASYKLTAGPSDGDYVTFSKRLPRVTTGAHGVEWVVSLDPNIDKVTIAISLYDGTAPKVGYLRYDYVNKQLLYYNSSGVYTKIADLDLTNLVTVPHVFKLVANEATTKYVRAIVDGTEYDLSSYALYTSVGMTGAPLVVNVTIHCHTGGTVTCYAGPVTVTCNEE